MQQICLVPLIGLPAAGKTSYCKYLLAQENMYYNLIHINCDVFLQEHKEYSKRVYNYERDKFKQLIRKILQNLKENHSIIPDFHAAVQLNRHESSKPFVLLIDDNNYYSSMREEFYRLAKSLQLHYGQIYFPIKLDVALQRNSQRQGKEYVPVEVVQRMNQRLVSPDVQKRAWEHLTLVLNENKMDLEAFLDFIPKVLQQKLHVSVQEVHETQPNTPAHNLDLHLRRRIKDIMSTFVGTPLEKRARALELNKKRQEILSQFTLAYLLNPKLEDKLQNYYELLT